MKLIASIGLIVVCSSAAVPALEAQQPPPPAPLQTQAPAPPPPPPAENIENMFSVAVYTWLGNGGPILRYGANDPLAPQTVLLPFSSKPSRSYGAIMTFPAKGFSRLELSYFQVHGSGFVTSPIDQTLAGTTVLAGDTLSRDYKAQNLKISYNYLTFPVPPLGAKMRIKTLFELQYLKLDPVLIGFPDVSPGTVATYSQNVLYPTFGAGVEYVPSKHFRFEAKGSGFAIPGHSNIWDAEGSLVTRIGSMEIFAGAKAYHFRTSEKKATYLTDTLWGPEGGVRWVFKKK